MPEHLRALVVLLSLAGITYWIAKPAALAAGTTLENFQRRQLCWLIVTATVFLAHNFWICIAVIAITVVKFQKKESNIAAFYFALLFAMPMLAKEVSGLGVFKHFFEINYPRLLSLTVLAIAYAKIRNDKTALPFGKVPTDWAIAAHILLQCFLLISANTFTNTLRQGVFYSVIDLLLPYYVLSRSKIDDEKMKEALAALAIAGLFLSLVAIFESTRHWLLFSRIEYVLDANWPYGNYLDRGDTLRAQGPIGQPIALGFIQCICLGAAVIVRMQTSFTRRWDIIIGIIIAGLMASLSRGPWLGGVLLGLLLCLGSPKGMAALAKLLAASAVATCVVLVSPYAKTIIDLLPFVGEVDDGNVTYRQQLLEIGYEVLSRDPWFGASDYFYSFEEMRQGEGIIDIVNSYLGVALHSGLVGLGIFIACLISPLILIFKAAGPVRRYSTNTRSICFGVLAISASIYFIIFTTSTILVMPYLMWGFFGLVVAYSQTMTTARKGHSKRFSWSTNTADA